MQLKYANNAADSTTAANHGINKVIGHWHIEKEVWGNQHLIHKTTTSEKVNFRGLKNCGSMLVLFCPVPKTNDLILIILLVGRK